MAQYDCKRCKKIFVSQLDYIRHQNKKGECVVDCHAKTFECPTCNKTFNRKFNLERHVKNCDNIESDEEIEDNSNEQNIIQEKRSYCVQHKCEHCGKNFSRKPNYLIHLEKYCEEARIIREELAKQTLKQEAIKKMVDKHEAELRELLENIEQNKSKSQCNIGTNSAVSDGGVNQNINNGSDNIINQNINNGIVNNNNNNNVDIKLVAFGKEDTSFITDEQFKKIISRGCLSLSEFINYLHFDAARPEYHNVMVSNFQNNCAMIYMGRNRWNLKNADEVIDDLFTSGSDLLYDKYQDVKKIMDQRNAVKFDKFMKDHKDPKAIKRIKKNIKMLLYNGKDLVEATKKKVDEQYKASKKN